MRIHHSPVLLLSIFGAAGGVSACSGEAPEGIASLQAPLSPAEEAVYGFESLSSWTTTAGRLALSDVRSAGARSLAISGVGYATLTSIPVSTTAALAKVVSLQIQLPQQQPNPQWYGRVTLYLDAPSRGIHNALVAERNLTGLPLGAFQKVEFSTPDWLAASLSGRISDLRVRIALNVPSRSGTYRLDDLRVLDDAGPSGERVPLPPWLRYCDDASCGGRPPVRVRVCPTVQPDCSPARATDVVTRVNGTPVSGVRLRANVPDGFSLFYDAGNASVQFGEIQVFDAPSIRLASDTDLTLSYYDVAPVWGGTTRLDFDGTLTRGEPVDSTFFRHTSYSTGSAAADLHARATLAVTNQRAMVDRVSEHVNALFFPTELAVLGEGNFSYGNGTITMNYGNPPYIDAMGGILNTALPRFAHENVHELFDEIEPAYGNNPACLNEGTADALAYVEGSLPEQDFGPRGLRGANFDTDGCMGLDEVHDIGNCPLWHVRRIGLLTPAFLRGIFHPQHAYSFDSCTLSSLQTGNALFVLFTEAAGGADVIPALDAAGIPHARTYAEARAALGF